MFGFLQFLQNIVLGFLQNRHRTVHLTDRVCKAFLPNTMGLDTKVYIEQVYVLR